MSFPPQGPYQADVLRSSIDITLEPSSYVDGVEIGRGDTDTDITYIRLKNADGEDVYLYPNATQDGLLVSDTKP